jgi:hypothetical protein
MIWRREKSVMRKSDPTTTKNVIPFPAATTALSAPMASSTTGNLLGKLLAYRPTSHRLRSAAVDTPMTLLQRIAGSLKF